MLGIALMLGTGSAVAALAGSPPQTRFVPDIEVFPQNFALVQDARSIVYVGNSDGVLTFDGEHWALTPLPNHDLVRSLAYDGDRRVYVGGYGTFGYLEDDPTGRPVYHDLAARFQAQINGDDIADIWDTAVTSQGVVFRAVKHLFLYDPVRQSLKTWRDPNRFGAVAEVGGKLIAQFRGEGLKQLIDGKWHMLPGTQALAGLVYDFVPLAERGLLMLSTDGGWRIYRDGKVSTFPVPDGLPASSHFSRGRELPDGTLALASDEGRIWFVEPDGSKPRSVRLSGGFLAGLIAANDGGVLAIGDEALYHVEWPARWAVTGAHSGLLGDLHGLRQWAGHWYALSGAGVFQSEGDRYFRPQSWTSHEAWDLLPVDDQSALLAESYSLLEIRDGKAHAISDNHFYPRVLLRSRYDPDRVYVGTELGFAVLLRRQGRWRLVLNHENGIAPRINSIVEAGPSQVWMGSDRGGLELVTFNDEGTHVLDLNSPGDAEGLVYGSRHAASIRLLPDQSLVVSTPAGIFRRDGDRFLADDLDGLDSLRQTDEWVMLAAAPNGDLWAYTYNHLYYRPEGKSWRREDVAKLQPGAIESLTFDGEGGALFGAGNQILRYDTTLTDAPSGKPPRILLRSVEMLHPDGHRERLPLNSAKPLAFPQGEFALAFRFALPEYDTTEHNRYRARLAGFEKQYSGWDNASQYTYSRFRPVDYRFELQGRDSHGRVSTAPAFAFHIVPAWYATGWAKGLWFAVVLLSLLVIAFLLARNRTHQLAKEKLRLEHMVAARTRELEVANRQLESMAHLDGLTGIPNRRRLDDYLKQVWAQCIERHRHVSVLLIDVDHFKHFNDKYGHLAGDRLLKRLVEILGHSLRRTEDLLARFGGEEFLVVLPGADSATAQEVAEAMRQQVEESSLGATISVGIAACIPTADMPLSRLIKQADRAMYAAKSLGRNRVASHEAEAL